MRRKSLGNHERNCQTDIGEPSPRARTDSLRPRIAVSDAKRAQQSEVQLHQVGQEASRTTLSEDVDWKPFPVIEETARIDESRTPIPLK
jgi:hypothetical protein